MNKLSLTLLFLILLSGTAQASAHGGGSTDVGNGGYFLQCSENDPPRSYDFLVTQNKMGKRFKVSPVASYQDSLERISSLIYTKLPSMSSSFDRFVQQIGNDEPNLQYVWKPLPPQVGVPSYKERNRLTTTCKNSSGEQAGFLSQVILRKPYPGSEDDAHGEVHVMFYFDPLIYGLLPQVDLSFLLIHEWLWNFTDDPEANRKADYILHSTWLEQASSPEAIEQLKKIGIRYP